MIKKEWEIKDDSILSFPEPVMFNGKVLFTPEELLKIREKTLIDAQLLLDSVRLGIGDFVPIGNIVTGLINFTWSHESE